MEITNNCYKDVKIKNQFQNWTQCTPVKLPAMAARSPKGERPMVAGFIVVRRRSTGPPEVTSGHLDDCRQDTAGASAENFVISRENRLVAKQSPGGGRQMTAGWLYDIVQGQENRPMSYWSRKIGIRQKSSSRLWIYLQLGRRLKYISQCPTSYLTNKNIRVSAPRVTWQIRTSESVPHELGLPDK